VRGGIGKGFMDQMGLPFEGLSMGLFPGDSHIAGVSEGNSVERKVRGYRSTRGRSPQNGYYFKQERHKREIERQEKRAEVKPFAVDGANYTKPGAARGRSGASPRGVNLVNQSLEAMVDVRKRNLARRGL